MRYVLPIALLLAMLGSILANAQGQEDDADDETIVVPRLRLGNMAPPLKIAEYIRGEEVDLDKGRGKNIYVIEFWATWCPPCRESVPHLSKLQADYRDDNVIVIGISMEDKEDVEMFAEKMGEKMDYVVAIDDEKYTTYHYMGGFDRSSIPHAFVVDRDGYFIWEGHPMMVEEGIKLALEDDEEKDER